MKKGVECSILIKHSRGKITTILTTNRSRDIDAKVPDPVTSQAEKMVKKKNKGGRKKRLEALLSYHQRLVEEKGLPPSRLMLKHAVAASPPTPPALRPDQEDTSKNFTCDHCDYSSRSKQGLKIHIGRQHKDQQKPVPEFVQETIPQLDGGHPPLSPSPPPPPPPPPPPGWWERRRGGRNRRRRGGRGEQSRNLVILGRDIESKECMTKSLLAMLLSLGLVV